MSRQTDARLAKLRLFLSDENLDAWIAPTSDPHGSEYLDEHYAFRKWLSGFTGSAGTLVVSADKAALFTDSRYWEQAADQLKGTGIELVRLTGSYPRSIANWCAANLKKGATVGLPTSLVSEEDAEDFDDALNACGFSLSLVRKDPAEYCWEDRPKRVNRSVYDHKESPRSRKEKLKHLAKKIKAEKADHLLITALDDIAWITNLRGSDIECNPVFYAYGLVSSDGTMNLYIDRNKLTTELTRTLLADGIRVHPYVNAAESVAKHLEATCSSGVIADPEEVSSDFFSLLESRIKVIRQVNPICLLKACKTKDELELIRTAMVKDGVALVRFYSWLEHHLSDGLTEGQIADKLLEFRQKLPGFVSLSFNTISAFGPNAALPHYSATDSGGSVVKGNGFLLIDSGAQFPQGTTDITRTIPVGKISEEMIADYTAVLRGHIRLAKSIFPAGISSQSIDAIAREPIWAHLADFGHGTGHGVGFFINVHEGPQRITFPRISPESDCIVSKLTAMREGMVTSNEPGLYRPGRWGIRIENLTACEFAGENEFGRFLKFSTLTLCPIDLKAVDIHALLPDEKQWLNEYHRRVRDCLLPHLDSDTAEWLRKNTESI